ncbi:MAG: hypothetical protein ACK55Z_37425, partial [bacterium]
MVPRPFAWSTASLAITNTPSAPMETNITCAAWQLSILCAQMPASRRKKGSPVVPSNLARASRRSTLI